VYQSLSLVTTVFLVQGLALSIALLIAATHMDVEGLLGIAVLLT